MAEVLFDNSAVKIGLKFFYIKKPSFDETDSKCVFERIIGFVCFYFLHSFDKLKAMLEA